MPHSSHKQKLLQYDNSRIMKCPCGQTFNFESEREQYMKFRMHRKFCPNLPKGIKEVSSPNKAMTLRGNYLYKTEKSRRVHRHH